MTIRIDFVPNTFIKNEAGTLGFNLSCPAYVLENQYRHMGEYLHDLELRAKIEKIVLTE